MNWKKGFKRLAILSSCALFFVGLLVSWGLTWDYYSYYKKAEKQAIHAERLTKGADGDSVNVRNKYTGETKTISRVRYLEAAQDYRAEAANYRSYFKSTVFYSLLGTVVIAGVPWLLYGIGLYLARGFRNP